MCYIIATRSKDESTKHGCVIVTPDNRVMSTGYNSFPSGINDNVKERQSHINGEKYFYIEHSERNAIYSAAKYGITLNGCRLYVQGTPCADCARAIIQAGIKKLVTHKQALDRSGHWQEDIEFAFNMLREAGVEIIIFDGKMGIGKILRSGEYWEP
jgi:dCMP deaminase